MHFSEQTKVKCQCCLRVRVVAVDRVNISFSLKGSQKSYTMVSNVSLKIITMNQLNVVSEYKQEEMENNRVWIDLL